MNRIETAIRDALKTNWMGHTLFCMGEVDSTNRYAEQLATEGVAHGTVITAEYQSAGKGSRGRNWESAAGSGIFMSVLLRPSFHPMKASMLTLVTAYSIAREFRERFDLDVKIKWPNDIVLNRKKAAGILTQMQADANGIRHVIIGIGVNVNTSEFAPELKDKATSLFLETGRKLDKEVLTAGILNRLEEDYEQFAKVQNLSFMKEEYESMLINKGESVRIVGQDMSWNGIALGINDDGELLIQRPDGKLETAASGEVSVRGLYSYV